MDFILVCMDILLSFFLGVLPIIIWLSFWLKEDAKNPEPKRFIFLTFLAGMFSALTAQVFGKEILEYTNISINADISLLAIGILATSEEVIKYIFAYFSALSRSFNDEPVDAIIYMITVALGFSAMENTMYLFDILDSKTLFEGIIISNMRFIGATVLHTASSAMIGITLAFAYQKTKIIKMFCLILGLILAIALHTSFNFLIINDSGGNIFKVFLFIWLIIMLILLFFEKIKSFRLSVNK